MTDPLSRRERQIMDLAYQLGEVAVSDVHERMADPPSYSAVRALMGTLVEKGHLSHRQAGRRYVYAPTVGADDASASALKRLVVEDLTTSLQQRVQNRTLPLYENRDAHNLAEEQSDARAANIKPFSITDERQLRRAADDATTLKWVLLEDGRISLGPTDTTHAVISGGRAVAAAGEVAIASFGRTLVAVDFRNTSGHYRPLKDVIDIATPFFEAHGVTVPTSSRKGHDE
jgi:predicted transcriptional regulator